MSVKTPGFFNFSERPTLPESFFYFRAVGAYYDAYGFLLLSIKFARVLQVG